jgi:ATP-dependent Lhr-like helicase
MEDAGWVRRGMFVAGLGAAQFAMPAALDMLRGLRSEPETLETLFLAATDPANPYGASLPWPRRVSQTTSPDSGDAASSLPAEDRNTTNIAEGPSANDGTSTRALSRTSGAGVVLINGNLTAFLRRRNQEIQVFLPEAEPERPRFARELAKKLAELAISRQDRKTGLLVGTINGEPARSHFLARFLEESGFLDTAVGFQMRRIAPIAMPSKQPTAGENGVDSDLDETDPEISEFA